MMGGLPKEEPPADHRVVARQMRVGIDAIVLVDDPPEEPQPPECALLWTLRVENNGEWFYHSWRTEPGKPLFPEQLVAHVELAGRVADRYGVDMNRATLSLSSDPVAP